MENVLLTLFEAMSDNAFLKGFICGGALIGVIMYFVNKQSRKDLREVIELERERTKGLLEDLQREKARHSKIEAYFKIALAESLRQDSSEFNNKTQRFLNRLESLLDNVSSKNSSNRWYHEG